MMTYKNNNFTHSKKKKKIKFKSNQNTKYDIISMQLTNWYGGDALKQELHQTHCVLTS